jgi:hypothetical protein
VGTDGNGLKDDAVVELGQLTEHEVVPKGKTYHVVDGARKLTDDVNLPSIEDSPNSNSERAKWVDYCVSLGADREFLENDTEHVVDDTVGAEIVDEVPPLTVAELKDLAARLGG